MIERVREYITRERQYAIDDRVTHDLRRKRLETVASSSCTLTRTGRHTQTGKSWGNKKEGNHKQRKAKREKDRIGEGNIGRKGKRRYVVSDKMERGQSEGLRILKKGISLFGGKPYVMFAT